MPEFMDLTPTQFARPKHEGCSSGSYMLNQILSGHWETGWVQGRIYELFGPEGSGKTTLTLHAIVQAQKKWGIAALIDAEHSLDIAYAKAIGATFNKDSLQFAQPDNGEEAFELVYKAIASGTRLVVVDSVGGLLTRAHLAGEVGDAHVAQTARLMSQEIPRLAGIAKKAGAAVIFTNQLREKVGNTGPGSNETTMGGRALKFWASVRIDVRSYRMDSVKESSKLSVKDNAIKKEDAGVKMTVKCVKNKLTSPFQELKLAINYGTGLDRRVDVAKFGLFTGVVDNVGDKTFTFEGKERKFATADSDLFKAVFQAAKAAYAKGDK